jgi:hypothetical protein
MPGPTPVAAVQLALPVLRHAADQLRHIGDLDVPFHRHELQRHQEHSDQAARAHRQALAARDTARAARDRTSAELQALNPWRPFSGRRRTELEGANRAAHRQLARARREVDTTRAELDRANQRLDHARQWLTRHEPEHRQRAGLATALDRDLDARTFDAASSPPPRWAHHILGPRPGHNPANAAVWDHAVAAVGQYRDIWHITDDHPTLGGRPHHYNDPRRDDWRRAAATLTHAAEALDRVGELDLQLRRDIALDHDAGIGISR